MAKCCFMYVVISNTIVWEIIGTMTITWRHLIHPPLSYNTDDGFFVTTACFDTTVTLSKLGMLIRVYKSVCDLNKKRLQIGACS